MLKKFLNEFREFALKGNVMSLAVGVIIGSSFQGVVTSLTENILSPIIGLFAKQNFNSLCLDVFGVNIAYGAFLTSVVNFLIMAFVVFMLIKGMNKIMSFNKHDEPKPPAPKCPFCFSDVREGAVRCPACTSHLPAP